MKFTVEYEKGSHKECIQRDNRLVLYNGKPVKQHLECCPDFGLYLDFLTMVHQVKDANNRAGKKHPEK